MRVNDAISKHKAELVIGQVKREGYRFIALS